MTGRYKLSKIGKQRKLAQISDGRGIKMLPFLQEILQKALNFLLNSFTLDVFLALIQAFFVARAIVTFLSRDTVMKHLGPKANKPVAYAVATLAGVALTT
jgi:uncharacterized membrane protein YraQ (UPF0718 family)